MLEREIDLLINFQAIHHINKIISSKHDWLSQIIR